MFRDLFKIVFVNALMFLALDLFAEPTTINIDEPTRLEKSKLDSK